MSDKQQFHEYYSRLSDDELARIALEGNLVSEAEQALADELNSRGISDLSEYKRILEDSRLRYREADRRVPTAREQQFRVWGFVCIAWISAAFGPYVLATDPQNSGSLEFCLMGAATIAFSCYMGIKAQRAGSRVGAFLKLKLPLILLGISTAITLYVRP